MAHTTDTFANLRTRLERDRATTLEEIERADADIAALTYDATTEGGAPTNHPGDEGSDVYEAERQQTVRGELAARVEQIDDALARMADGTYGVCMNCGKDIPRERLEALPFATLCVDCQSQAEGEAPRLR